MALALGVEQVLQLPICWLSPSRYAQQSATAELVFEQPKPNAYSLTVSLLGQIPSHQNAVQHGQGKEEPGEKEKEHHSL
jgi:hypothetical protein